MPVCGAQQRPESCLAPVFFGPERVHTRLPAAHAEVGSPVVLQHVCCAGTVGQPGWPCPASTPQVMHTSPSIPQMLHSLTIWSECLTAVRCLQDCYCFLLVVEAAMAPCGTLCPVPCHTQSVLHGYLGGRVNHAVCTLQHEKIKQHSSPDAACLKLCTLHFTCGVYLVCRSCITAWWLGASNAHSEWLERVV